jgi:fatty acid-binding protein DegV
MAQRVGDNAKVHVWINDGGMPTEAQQLKEMVSSRFNCAEIYLTPNTLIMAVHLGPVVGLGFYAD